MINLRSDWYLRDRDDCVTSKDVEVILEIDNLHFYYEPLWQSLSRYCSGRQKEEVCALWRDMKVHLLLQDQPICKTCKVNQPRLLSFVSIALWSWILILMLLQKNDPYNAAGNIVIITIIINCDSFCQVTTHSTLEFLHWAFRLLCVHFKITETHLLYRRRFKSHQTWLCVCLARCRFAFFEAGIAWYVFWLSKCK